MLRESILLAYGATFAVHALTMRRCLTAWIHDADNRNRWVLNP